MAISITTFTADESVVTIKLTTDLAIDTAELILNDGTVMDIASDFNPTGVLNEYEAIVSLTYPDGILILRVSTSGENFTISIGNLLLGNQYLMKKALQEEYDCALLQQLEACKQLILGNEGSTAQDIYVDVQNQAASCTDAEFLAFSISGTNIWIEEGKYIIK